MPKRIPDSWPSNADIIAAMNLTRFLILASLACLLLMGLWLPVSAAPVAQVQYPSSPTPGVDGRIIYIVQPNDNCTTVVAKNGMKDVDQLRSLNNITDANCTIVEGQELLIGLGGAAVTPTSGPTPTPAPPTAVPTALSGTTEICVLLFNDQNGDSFRQEVEPAVAGGAVSVTESNGAYSATLDTIIPSDPDAYQGICFTDVPEGHYNISMGIPSDYNSTMSLAYSLQVKAGDRAFVDFGVQSIQTSVTENGPAQKGTSPILAIFGALLLLGGAGLGWYAWRSARPESKLGGGGILKK
jgi:hypothetical protein